MKIAIVCDSTGSITEAEQQENGIYINYLSILFGTDSFEEFREISPEAFVTRSTAMDDLPTTSQPTPGVLMDLYESLLAKGYEHIIHITLSSKLSGSFQTAKLCAEDVAADKITVFDSRTVAYTQGLMAILAAKKAKAGADAKEVITYLEEMRENCRLYAAVFDLTNLKKGGRLSNVEAALGSLLQIKPLVKMSPEGKLEPYEKIRTFKKALKRLTEIVVEANLNEGYELAVAHIANLESAQAVQAQLQEAYPQLDVRLRDLSLVVAVHGGPGAVAVCWVKK